MGCVNHVTYVNRERAQNLQFLVADMVFLAGSYGRFS